MKRILLGGLILLLIVGTGLPAFPQFTATTIANIQNELYSPGTQLEITGIVSAIHPVPVPSYVYVQDAAAVRSGIRCYGGGGTVTGINMGDEVTVQGVYDDPFGETQLNFSATGSIVVNSTGNTLYTPLALTGASFPYDAPSDATPAEDYEGVLVRVASVIITDTIPLTPERTFPGIKVLSVAHLLGEAVKRIHRNESVSRLFDSDEKESDGS